MHALGILITRYNALEFTLFLHFYHFLNDYRTDVPAVIFSRLNNQHRLDVLRRYSESENNGAVKVRLDRFLSDFDICNTNRNFLAHSKIHNDRHLELGNTSAVLQNPKLILKKAPKNEPLRDNYTELEASELRQIADDIKSTDDFGFALYVFMSARRTGGSFTLADGKKITPSLPEILPTPRTLSLSDSLTPAAGTAEKKETSSGNLAS